LPPRITTATARRCQEIRLYEVFDPGCLDPEWKGLVGAVVRVTRERLDFSAQTGLWSPSADQTAYYLCSRFVTVGLCAEAIRGHWRIENGSHYVRDTTFAEDACTFAEDACTFAEDACPFAEDACRTRKNPGILARLRSFASNILRFNGASNIKDTRYPITLAGWEALARLRFS
jgi:predicted transposase YbfD/YdcC